MQSQKSNIQVIDEPLYRSGTPTTNYLIKSASDNLLGQSLFNDNGTSFAIGTPVGGNARIFGTLSKTFTNPLTSTVSDIGNNQSVVFTYSGTNTASDSTSIGFNDVISISGAFTPRNAICKLTQVSNVMSSGTLEWSIAHRSGHAFAIDGVNAVTAFHADYASQSFNNKNSGTATLTKGYSFYSGVPIANAGVAADFIIGDQYGFYCDDYRKPGPIAPVISHNTGRDPGTITKAWQMYLDGTNGTNIGSYIGHRLGVGFTIAPTANTDITALLHVGAGTTSSSQLRLTAGVAPTSPNDGDIWFDGTNLKMRIAGSTKTFTII